MPQTYLIDRDLAERYAVSRVSIWRWAQQGVLPKPIRVGANCTRWRADEIEGFEARKAAEREG